MSDSETKKGALKLLDYINSSPTAFHAVANAKARLAENGFSELNEKESWPLQKGGKYFVVKNQSALVAFVVGTGEMESDGMRIVAAHTDSPNFRIKPSPEISVDKYYVKLNTGTYGGAIMNTWFDRPLAVAGKVVLQSGDIYNPKEKLIDINRPLLVIPNLAIHFNREVNEGKSYNAQVDTLPLAAYVSCELERSNYLMDLLCAELGVEESEIIDFELMLYEYDKGILAGANEEFISASRLDDLWMVHAGLEGFLLSEEAGGAKHTKILFCPDNEEIGSLTAQGGYSEFLRDTIARMLLAQGKNAEAFYTAVANSFFISADLAHGTHPNYADKHDPTTRPVIGKGPVLKYSIAQKYATNAVTAAVFANICRAAEVPMQKYINRSDVVGGSTIGSMLAANFAARVVDMGAPILAMHSIRELGSVNDNAYCVKLFKTFFEA